MKACNELPARVWLYKNYDYLFNAYIIDKLSTTQISRKTGFYPATISGWLREFSIPVREKGEAISLVLSNHLNISSRLRSMIEGELLGDGCLVWKSNSHRSAVYEHSSKYKEYLQWMSSEFSKEGMEQVGKINSSTAPLGISGNDKYYTSYRYRSRAYIELAEIRERFYPKGKKVVPDDLKLNIVSLRRWFLGDGCLSIPKTANPFVIFSTDCFDNKSLSNLMDNLDELGFKNTHNSAGIRISSYSTIDFLKFIYPCPISCYAYKWRALEDPIG